MHQNCEFEQYPQCGYGLAGLCCSLCLEGPCRISPFDKKSQKGQCGDDADRMVAKNLLHIVQSEVLDRLHNIINIEESCLNNKSEKDIKIKKEHSILKHLLGNCQKESILLGLFPSEAFTNIYENILSKKSWIQLLFYRPAISDDIRSIVRSINELVLYEMAIANKLCTSDYEKNINPGHTEINDAIKRIETNKIKRIILYCDVNAAPSDFRSKEKKIVSNRYKSTVEIIHLRFVTMVPSIINKIYLKNTDVIKKRRIIGIIVSNRISPILATLACGLTVTSLPRLPIYGSRVVSQFITKDMHNITAPEYLDKLNDEAMSAIQRYLGNK